LLATDPTNPTPTNQPAQEFEPPRVIADDAVNDSL
jgi:hypothetical protein